MDCREMILSNEFADILFDFDLENTDETVEQCTVNVDQNFNIVYARRSQIPTAIREWNYPFLPKCYGLLEPNTPSAFSSYNQLALIDAGILSVQSQPLNLTGKGVLIGFLDTGIRYQHPAFLDMFGNTRIHSIWDQTIQTGTAPAGFLYGSEYTRVQINQALKSDDPLSVVPSTDENGHGTILASIAAGSRIDENGGFIGAAPESELVVVKLKEAKPYLRSYYCIPEDVPCYEETDLILALKYLQSFVLTFQKPMVICMALGTTLGDHTGASLLGRYIERILQKKNISMAIGVGNEGNASRHFRGTLSDAGSYETVEVRVAPNNQGFVMDFWGQAPNLFSVTFRSPGGESVQWINPKIKGPQEYSFVFEETRLIINYYLVEPNSGAELIRFRFTNPTQGIWSFRITAQGDATNAPFDLWLPLTDFSNTDVYFLSPNPYTTATDPSYVRHAVSVTSYQDENGSFYTQSGRGFSLNNFPKPDVAAPGVRVSSPFGNQTGSSISCAITAGGMAQIMQWGVVNRNDLFLDGSSVRNLLIRGAKRESYLTYPNEEWGYGKLSIQGVFEFLAER